MSDKPKIVSVNIYKYEDIWCYSAWTTEEFDHSCTIGIEDSASEQEAREAARVMFPGAQIKTNGRVPNNIEEAEECLTAILRDCLQLARDIVAEGRPHSARCDCLACGFAVTARKLVEAYEQTEKAIEDKRRNEQ